jgi:DNA polymerase III alpha subunit
MLLKTDELGIPRFTNRNLIDMIYSGNIEKCHVVLCEASDDVEQFNRAMEEQGLPGLQMYIPIDVDQKTFDGVCQSEWFMPDNYKNISNNMLLGWLLDRCERDTDKFDRVKEEFRAYKERGMLDLLRYMIYLVDFMRENGIVWGVGRGSSVASYILYLIGVHKINSLKYNLDWREFLR